MLAGMTRNLDDFSEVRWVFSLDVGVWESRVNSHDSLENELFTDRVFDSEAIQLRFRESAPYFGFVDLIGIIQATINGYDMFDKNINSHRMLIVFLVDRQRFLIQTVICRNLGDLSRIIILQLVDISNNFALLGPNGRQKEKVLQVLVVAEG